MKRSACVSFLLVLALAALAYGADQPPREDPAEAVAEAVDVQRPPEAEADVAASCSASEVDAGGPKVYAGGFGSHCSSPFTCTIQEPGLGLGCTCTYRCSCAFCNGQLTSIDCVLIDDGGCFACPS